MGVVSLRKYFIAVLYLLALSIPTTARTYKQFFATNKVQFVDTVEIIYYGAQDIHRIAWMDHKGTHVKTYPRGWYNHGNPACPAAAMPPNPPSCMHYDHTSMCYEDDWDSVWNTTGGGPANDSWPRNEFDSETFFDIQTQHQEFIIFVKETGHPLSGQKYMVTMPGSAYGQSYWYNLFTVQVWSHNALTREGYSL